MIDRSAMTRGRGRLLLAAGIVALVLTAISVASSLREPVHRVTLTAGIQGTTRALLARALAASARGVEVEVVDSENDVGDVERGAIDFAIAPTGSVPANSNHIREVTPLYLEVLHLTVRGDLADAVTRNLQELRGHTVDLGPPETVAAELAEAVMAFADLKEGDAARGFAKRNLRLGELEGLIRDGGVAALPDAIFHLATMPSIIVQQLVRIAGYRVVPLPFAEAFWLNEVITGEQREALHHTHDAEIPAYTYQTVPAVPPELLHTFGLRLLLLANENVPAAAVERLLEAVFESRYAHMTRPPLTTKLLDLPRHLERHAGSLAYEHRNHPFITGARVDKLNNTLGVLSALGGAVFFLWQWRRQRAQAHRDQLFGSYISRIAGIEQRAAELELSATLELDALIELQRELLQLKSDTLRRFTAGEIGDQTTFTDLLVPLNAARDHIGDLILHVRQSLEAQAEAEGRSAQALWNEATEGEPQPEAVPLQQKA